MTVLPRAAAVARATEAVSWIANSATRTAKRLWSWESARRLSSDAQAASSASRTRRRIGGRQRREFLAPAPELELADGNDEDAQVTAASRAASSAARAACVRAASSSRVLSVPLGVTALTSTPGREGDPDVRN